MPRIAPNATATERRTYFSAEAVPFSHNHAYAEHPNDASAPGDPADAHPLDWELDWIDLGGEG